MPTVESVAIREELAIARIEQAAITLKARTGAEFERIDLNVYMAPMERQAVVLEQTAALLESLVVVLQEPIQLPEGGELRASRQADDSDEEQEGEDDASTDQGKRRPSPRRKT